MIVLRGRELQDRDEILGFELGTVSQDLVARGAGREEVKHVLHANAKTSKTWTAPADVKG